MTGSSNNLFGNLAAGAAAVPAIASAETDAALAAKAAASEQETSETQTDEASEAPTVSELDILKARARTMGIAFSNNIKVETLRAKIAAKLNDEDDAPSAGNADEGESDDENDTSTDAAIGSAPGPDFTPSPAAVAKTVAVVPSSGSGGSLLAQIATMSAEDKAAMLHLLGANVTTAPVAAASPKASKAATKAAADMALRKEIHDREMALVRVRITNLDPKKKDLPGEILTVANEWIGTVRKYIPYGEQTDDGYHVPVCLLNQLRERTFLQIKTVKNANGRGTTTKTADVREFAIEVLPPLTVDELGKLAAAQAAAAGN